MKVAYLEGVYFQNHAKETNQTASIIAQPGRARFPARLPDRPAWKMERNRLLSRLQSKNYQ